MKEVKDSIDRYVKKKIEVLNKLEPIAKVIGIELDYIYDPLNNREILKCNNQMICVNGTSLYGIENEFWGYVHIIKYDRLHHFSKHHKNAIRRYWFDEDFNQPFCK